MAQVDLPPGPVSRLDGTIAAADVLALGLQKAVAKVGGLGGLVHMSGSAPGLCLAASSGLPATFTGRWQQIRDDPTAAPAIAARLGRPVWCPSLQGPGTSMASVPLRATRGEAFGALSVVTASAGEPTARQWDALQEVAGWSGDLLEHARPPLLTGKTWKSRQHTAERAATGRAAAERAAQIQELTAALAEAVTSQDVVATVAERVLRPFEASGLVLEVAEGDHLRVMGAVGYPQRFVDQMDGSELRKIPSIAAALHGHRPFFLSSPENTHNASRR